MRLERTSFAKRMAGYEEAVELPTQPVVEGRLLRMVGLTLEAEGLRAALGSRCLVINDDSYHPVQVEAEVMGFSAGKIYLMPVGSLAGIAPGARVVPLPDTGRLPMGMSMLGRVLDGAGRALEILLTGEQIAAQEAHRLGLVNRVVPAGELMNEARKLAATLAAKAPIAVRYIIDAVNKGARMTLPEAQVFEATLFGLVASTDDMHEGTRAFLEKRKPEFKGK